jgi:hypothetical protein
MNGADVSRGGGLIRVADNFTPQIVNLYRSKYGTQASATVNNGDVSCVWALEVTASTGQWQGWMPTNGWWPTMGNAGNPVINTTNVNYTYMIWGGSFTPMIRPLVSRMDLLPVELLYLRGTERDGGALLTWGTASEKNSQGFFIERKEANVADAAWGNIDWVQSKNANSTTTTGYVYQDRNVRPGTYDYRLIQMDLDGTQRVTNTVRVSIGASKDFSLEQNYPNPFNPETQISFTLPAEAPTTLEIYNALGQKVRTLVNEVVGSGVTTKFWDGKDDNGNELTSGTYMYKLTSGQYSASRKMTLSK